LIAAADYDELGKLLHPLAARELTPEVIAPVWRSVLTEIGELQRFSGARVEVPGGEEVASDEQVIGTVICELALESEAGLVR
jgi:hypothetical protein